MPKQSPTRRQHRKRNEKMGKNKISKLIDEKHRHGHMLIVRTGVIRSVSNKNILL